MRQRWIAVSLALALGPAFPAGAAQRRIPGRPASIVSPALHPSADPAKPDAQAHVGAELGARQEQADALTEGLAEPGRMADAEASDAAARLLENGPAVQGAAVEAADLPSSGSAPLSASSGGVSSNRSSGPRQPQAPLDPKPSWSERYRDLAGYTEVYLTHLYFYLYTNIVNKWPPFFSDWKKLANPPISRPRAFFAHMRVMGQTGVYYPLGFVARDEQSVIKEARITFATYFDGAGIGYKERDAFERFLQRALVFNKEKRAAPSFRKFVRDSLLNAASMEPAKIAAYLDTLYVPKETEQAADFQGRTAEAILAKFTTIVEEELAKEPAEAKDRIVGMVLIGSFAYGAATPSSDLDGMPLSADGSSTRVDAFTKRLLARWKTEGFHKTNPAIIHEHALRPSRRLLRMVINTPYLVLSHDRALASSLDHRGEPSTWQPSDKLKSPSGYLLRWGQYAAVYATTLFTK